MVALIAGLLLAACGRAPEVAALLPGAATVAPTEFVPRVTATPTVVTAPTEPAPVEPTPADWTQTVTQEGDYWVLGNPAAPVRMIDYSDFL